MVEEGSPPADQHLEQPLRRPARRRWRRRLALGGLALLGLLALAYTVRARWAGPLLARYAITRAREELGAELSFERVTGSWWRDLVLEGVRWHSAKGPLLEVEDARIELRYSLRGLLRGAPELTVRIAARGIELEATSSGAGSDPLPDLPRLELDLRDIVVRRPGHESTRLDSLRASGGLHAHRAQVERLELVAGENRLTLVDAALDLPGEPRLSGDSWLELARSLRGKLSASLPDTRELARALDLPVRAAELELSSAKGRAQVTGKLELEGGAIEISYGELVLPASAGWSELQLDLDLRGELHDLAPLGELVGQELAGRWQGSIAVQGPLRAPTGRFIGHGEGLRVQGITLTSVDVDVQTDGKTARFERCEISGPALEAVLRGGVQLEPLELVDMAMNISADGLSLSELLPFPCEHAFLHARLSGPLSAPSGQFELSASGAQLEGLRVDDAETRGRITEGSFEVAELHLTSGESTIEAAGTIQSEGLLFTAELTQLGLLWRGTRVELERGAVLRFSPGRLAVEGLALTSSSAGVPGSAKIALEHEDGTTRGRLEFVDYDAGPLLALFLPPAQEAGTIRGRIAGELGSVAGATTSALTIDLALDGWRVDPAWPELSAVLRGEFDGRVLDLERFELGFEDDEAARISGALRVPADPAHLLAFKEGPVALRLDVATGDAARSLRRAGIEPELSATGPCTLALELAGQWKALAGTLALAAEDVTLGREASARACDFEAEVAFGERVRIEHALFSAPSGTIRLEGAVEAPLDLPRWLADRWALLEAPLALDARLDLADISWIAGLSADLRRTSGQVAGHLAIGGTALAPSLAGALELRAGELRLSSSGNPVRNLAANVSFEKDVVRIDALVGEVGGAPVSVSGTLEPFGPFRRLDLAMTGKNLLLARSSHLRLRADAELVIKGTPSRLSIGGGLALAEGRYTTEISPLEELLRAGRRSQPSRTTRFTLWPEGFLADAELDVHLGGLRTFEYRTNLLEAALRPDAWLRGTGAFPVIEGSVYVEEASLVLPSGTLKLASGLMTFRREDPLRPEAALTAEMRVQRHDVRAVATGTLDELEITLSSSPPLASDDLWILVLTGQLPVARGEDRSSAAMEALAVFLARDALVRWFGSDEDDAANLLERFEIDVGAKTSQTGQPTGRVLFYLKPETRRSGRATYLSAEIDEYDRVNYSLGIVFRPR